uniref:RING-type domain-containing protein n=1 Tax=Oryzias latipes TaxID=8090 RepID=A0A3P9H2A5_ORYLA
MEEHEQSRLEELLTCPVCQDIFSDPRQLPCGHSMCLSCWSVRGCKLEDAKLWSRPQLRGEFLMNSCRFAETMFKKITALKKNWLNWHNHNQKNHWVTLLKCIKR